MARALTLVEQIRNSLSSREYAGDPEEDLLNYEAPNFDSSSPKEEAERVRVLKDKIRKLGGGSDSSYEKMVRKVLSAERNIENYETNDSEGITPEMEAAQRDFLEKFLTNLKPGAREVISLRLEGKTLDEVGEAMGFTRERARQIEDATLEFFHKTRMYKDATAE